MRTKLSLDNEGYKFMIDGGLIGILFISGVGVAVELLSICWNEFKPFSAPVGTLAVGMVFGMMLCRLAPIWKRITPD